jgi:hypothetical protein
MPERATVISLEDYRRRRREKGSPPGETAALGAPPSLVWAPVWCWICWCPMTMVGG